MTEQRSEIDSLFQRMAARSVPAVTPEAEMPVSAALATGQAASIAAPPVQTAAAQEEWPLLVMLRQFRRVWHAPHMMMAVEDPLPLTPPKRMPATAAVAAPQPAAAERHGVADIPSVTSASLSPLEELFKRAEQTGQAQKIGSVFEPAPQAPLPQAVPLPPTPPRMAPPPLKTRATPSSSASSRAPAAADAPAPIAPRQRDWQPLDNIPSHLFDRARAR